MELSEVAKEYKRMCKAHRGCEGCELDDAARPMACGSYVLEHPDEAEKIIKNWSKEHPEKTRQSELLKLFPNASICSDGYIQLCPKSVDGDFKCPEGARCWECRKRYWLEEIEEEQDGRRLCKRIHIRN